MEEPTSRISAAVPACVVEVDVRVGKGLLGIAGMSGCDFVRLWVGYLVSSMLYMFS